MERREFLGWEKPLLGMLVEWLWQQREEMPNLLVVVPTGQSGRRLREALAAKGACLAPRVVTPGSLMQSDEADGRGLPQAAVAAELAGWVEVLEKVADWGKFSELFPEPKVSGRAPGWSLALAKSLVAAERQLQGAAMTLADAAKQMQNSMERERWQQLDELWRQKEKLLQNWGMWSRGKVVKNLLKTPIPAQGKIVLAGTPDLPEAVVRRLQQTGANYVSLVAAPPELAEGFDEFGRVQMKQQEDEANFWRERELAWPEQVQLESGPSEQAEWAVSWVANNGFSAENLALGAADEEVAEEIARSFERAGWIVHNPAGGMMPMTRAWLQLWRTWLMKSEVATAVDLLGMTPTKRLCGDTSPGFDSRMTRARQLSTLRDRRLVHTEADVQRGEKSEQLREEKYLATTESSMSSQPEKKPIQWLAADTMERLELAKQQFLRLAQGSFAEAMANLIKKVRHGENAKLAKEWDAIDEWLTAMQGVIKKVDRKPEFWLQLLIDDLGQRTREIPEKRVADVVGWLELLHEPGENMIIGGFNEGQVPGTASVSPWISEGVRKKLALPGVEQWEARDSYLFEALMRSRKRMVVSLGKTGRSGDVQLPSRLLFAAHGRELAERVEKLSREVAPMDANVVREIDWTWKIPKKREITRISVTALKDYLACPTRFYLKHVLKMDRPDPESMELDARKFGTLIHSVLENWGLDETARELTVAEDLQQWLWNELEQVVRGKYGEDTPLAVRIQIDAARKRLGWFAQVQVRERMNGWRVQEIERKFEKGIEGVTVVGKADRIDIHEDGSLRVIDYKTFSKSKKVKSEHLTEIKSNTRIADHLYRKGTQGTLELVPEVVAESMSRNKLKPHIWRDLQVPLYAHFLQEGESAAELGYWIIGESKDESKWEGWENFSNAERESALRCAGWIIRQIKEGIFEPASERIKYDDYEILTAGSTLREMVTFTE